MSNSARNQPRQPRGVPTGGQWRATARPEGSSQLDADPRLHRSAGAIVGGGYRGLTPELDSAVDEAASSMAERFGSAIEIRFNSDRRRGGAWLVTHPGHEGLGGNTWIGINADLALTREEAEQDETMRRIYADDADKWQQYLDSYDGRVHISVRVSEEALRDRSLGHQEYPGDKGPKVFEQEVPDVATAIDLMARVSIAGDKAEIERRRELVEAYKTRHQELQDRTNERWAKEKRGREPLPNPLHDTLALRNPLSVEYNKAEAELIERFWSEIDGAKL